MGRLFKQSNRIPVGYLACWLEWDECQQNGHWWAQRIYLLYGEFLQWNRVWKQECSSEYYSFGFSSAISRLSTAAALTLRNPSNWVSSLQKLPRLAHSWKDAWTLNIFHSYAKLNHRNHVIFECFLRLHFNLSHHSSFHSQLLPATLK